jgi:hypothetical protein
MTPADQVRELFGRVIELPRDKRDAFLVEHCVGDPATLDVCRQLLLAYEAGFEREHVTSSGSQREWSVPDSDTSTTVLSPGGVFGGYRIGRVIGRGGMGEVYEAEQIEDGRRIALKVLRRSQASPRERSRFLREGRLAASIAHPNSVFVFGTEEIEGKQIITMELLTGGTLRDRVVAEGPMPVRESIDAILDAIAGLAAAAASGVLHRDVKPSNCFIDHSGRVKIGDYGLSIPSTARDETALTEMGMVLGTPGFSSPEQLQGEPFDIRSDIYSVGATLFYLLTGRAPFEDSNIIRLVTKATHDAAPTPRQFRASIPRSLAQVILKCLEKDASRRFPGYGELAAALRKYVAQRHVAAPLGARLFAGAMDLAIIVLAIRISAAVVARWSDTLSVEAEIGLFTLLGAAIGVAYFGCSERFGRSAGKHVFGLCVQRASAGPLAEWRVWCRAIIFVTVCWIVPSGVLYGRTIASASVVPERVVRGNTFPRPRALVRPQIFSTWNVAGLMLLFCTAAPARRYRGIHELLSGTATHPESSSRDQVAMFVRTAPVASLRDVIKVGPYRLSSETATVVHAQQWMRAHDPLLDRAVWVQLTALGADGPTATRRELDRPTRPRWLAGKHTVTESWDAFELQDGFPLRDAIAQRPAMQLVQGWLAELAAEIREGIGDGTVIQLDHERLWVTQDGRLQLLDAPTNSADDVEAGGWTTPTTLESAQKFLRDLVERLFRESQPPDGAAPRAPLPGGVATLVGALEARRFQSFEELAGAFDALRFRDFTIRKTRRAAPALGLAVLLVVIAQGPLTRMFEVGREVRALETYALLGYCLDVQSNLSHGRPVNGRGLTQETAQRCIATLSKVVDSAARARWRADAENRRLIDEALARYPEASFSDPLPEAVPLALRVALTARPRNDTASHFATTYTLMAVRRTIWAGAALALMIVVITGRSPILASLGMAVVLTDGSKPERWRMAARTAMVWAPLVGASLFTLVTCPKPDPPLIQFGATRILFAFSPLLLAAGTSAYSTLNPTRSFAEQLTDTWLVRL